MNSFPMFLDKIEEFFSSGFYIFLVFPALIAALIILLYNLLILMRKNAIGRLIYSRSFSEEGVYAGDSVVLTEVIYNPTVFPLFRLDVGCYISTGLEIDGETTDVNEYLEYFSSRFHLPPFTRITRTHTVKCNTRGHYVLQTAEIYCDRKYIYIPSKAELFVYPKPLGETERILPQLNLLGSELSKNRFINDPFMFVGVRDYIPGDAFSSINFKASARTIKGGVRQLMVNNHDFSSQLNIMIYMDFDVPRFMKIDTPMYEDLIELGLSYSAEIISRATLQGGKVGFAANAKSYDGSMYLRHKPFAGTVHVVDIFKNLAAITPMTGASFLSLLDADLNYSPVETDIVIITFDINAELESRIRRLRRYGKGVSVITLGV
ncbi:MAG: DUF58 domain-containing protein [Eubacteriales bacterium]|nr:DUF58 domain-containing protein [Eubacteriales bacterium]MDD4422403.1 DUF58 domain-containing protein [Eubacteriales bacterium]